MFVPFLSRLFSVSAMTASQIGIVFGLAFIPTVIIQIARGIKAMVYCSKNKN